LGADFRKFYVADYIAILSHSWESPSSCHTVNPSVLRIPSKKKIRKITTLTD